MGIFFSNATAHYQHKYWSHFDPSQFSLKPNATELETYGNVIRFGYQAHDRLIGKAMALAGPGTAIALCTALSQQPMLDYEVRGGKHMFLVKDFAALQAALGMRASGARRSVDGRGVVAAFRHGGRRRRRVSQNLIRQDRRRPCTVQATWIRRQVVYRWLRVFASEVDARTTIVNAAGASAPFHEYFLQDGNRDHRQASPGRHILDDVRPPARPPPRRALPRPLPLTDVRGKLEQALAYQA